jgi:hypothetical protein
MNNLKVEPIECLNDLLNLSSLDDRLKSCVPLNEMLNLSKESLSKQQKVLICHDFKGNYLNHDAYLYPKCDDDDDDQLPFSANGCFRFATHFVYFSHKFVSIPPICW